MNKNRGAKFLGGFPDNIEQGMIEVSAIGSVAMIVWIDMGTDFNSAETELAHTTGQFLRRKIDILQWNCSETGEPFRLSANDFSNVIVQKPTQVERVARLCPVTEHHRHSRKHLH